MSFDLQITTNGFVKKGSAVYRRKVLAWALAMYGIQLRTNVKEPQALTKLSAFGTPKPYSAADEQNGNGAKFTDRILNVYQSKWDSDFDPEVFRNTYLASDTEAPFVDAAINHMADEYLNHLIRSTIYFGVRNPAGTTPADIATGFGKIIADEITATRLTPILTGAITSANAVTKVEDVAHAVDPVLRELGFRIHCSFNVFDKYKQHYRSINGYKFEPAENGQYKIDGVNAILCPCPYMGQSQRLIATLDNNMVVGTDLDRVQVHASLRRNIVEVRQLFPLGMEFQDLELVYVNDQA